jgi:dihydroxy-acid dehydratase
MSLGEDLMKPSAMLYRNLLAMEVEEYLRSYPLDGVVVTANCDKSIPGGLMGALSADLPTLVHVGGPRAAACVGDRRIGTTDVWRLHQQRQAGRLSDSGWQEVEESLGRHRGACNVMGTACTMAILVETLGLMLPGTALIPATDPAGARAAHETGQHIVKLVSQGTTPSSFLNRGSFLNAATVLSAIGGSTNAVIHLVALAGRAGIEFTLEDIHRAGRSTGLLTDIAPSGRFLIDQMNEDGGVPTLLKALGAHVDAAAATASGLSVGEIAERATSPRGSIRGPGEAPAGPTIDVLYGSLAPDGAVVKRSTAREDLLRHRGPALVFDDYHDMRGRIDDPELDVTPETVLVMRGCGPVGAPGMPEWGMIPIPAKLLADGVTDMLRLTDARMSGTSFGTVLLHLAPESAVGGPLALVRNGDLISVDIDERRLDLLVDDDELIRRRSAWTPAASPHERGWPALYRQHVTQADQGCDLDFLRLGRGSKPVLVPPVVGRS